MIPAFFWAVLVSLAITTQTAGQECPFMYERFCPDHSYCLPPNTQCQIEDSSLSPDQIYEVVDLHNTRRSEVATGKKDLLTASNMLEMEWDDELAAVAQNYANQCIFQHDRSDCRRVGNFNVGQNIAYQMISGGSMESLPPADWKFAVNAWFDEIENFSSELICPFKPAKRPKEYGHFTQVAWANTFRVGCGYVLYRKGSNKFIRLYICNYGPAGNMMKTCVYEAGDPCSGCPINSCCGQPGCSKYEGLCHRTTQDGPMYPPPQPNLFYCDFQNNSDCDYYIEGVNNWKTENTLSGNHLGIELVGGQSSMIVFKKQIKPTDIGENSAFCLLIKYRKGPFKSTEKTSNTATTILYVPSGNWDTTMKLGNTQQFSTFKLTLQWKMETQLKISFSIPEGDPPQFLDIQSILALDGLCQ